MSPGRILAVVASAFWLTNPLHAQINGFGTGANWSLNTAQGSQSSPAIAGGVLTLVNGQQSGTSSFFTTPQFIGNFTASFTWVNVGAGTGAGFTFCLQNSSATAVGDDVGNDLGYVPIPLATGIAFNLLSSSNASPGVGYAPQTVPYGGAAGGYSPTGPVNFDSGDPMAVQINYSNGVLNLSVTDTTTTNTFTTAFSQDLTTAVGATSAFVGFTGGGLEPVDVVISNFVFTPGTQGTPPSTFSATFTNNAGNIDVSKTKGNETDPVIAFNPAVPAQMFVAANTNVEAGLFAASSSNGGSNWTTVNLTNIPAGAFPSIAWDGYGNLFLAYADGGYSGINVAVSTNSGQSFTLLTNLATGDFALEPRIAVGTGGALGSVWVLYKDFSLAYSPLVAQGASVTGSNAFGTFGLPELIPGSTNDCGFGDIVVGPQGQVMVAYQNLFDIPGTANDFVSIDTDGLGPNTFSAAVVAANNVIGGNTIIPAMPNGAGVNGGSALAWDTDPTSQQFGKAYLVFTGAGVGGGADTDIFLSTSSDSGATWTPQVKVNDDTGHNSQFMPRVAVDPTTGILALSWYDCRRDMGQQRTQHTTNAMVVDTNQMPPATNLVMSNYFTTNFTGTVDATSNDDAVIFATVSLNGGISFQTDKEITSDTTNAYEATLAVSPTDFGDYIGLTYYAGTFYPVWADNSGSKGSNPDGSTNTFDIEVAPTVLQGLADVSVSQVVTNSTNLLQVGSIITYFITVSNAGPTAVTQVGFTNVFPPQVSVIIAFPTNNGVHGNYVLHGNTLTWSVGALAVHGTATLQVRTTAVQIGQASNLAIVSPGPGVVDLFPNNNQSILLLTIYGADMSLTMTSTPSVIGFGAPGVTYAMTVSNEGPVTATGVVLSNTLPLNFVPSSVTTPPGVTYGTGPNPNDLSFNIGSMTNGQTDTIYLTAQLPPLIAPNPLVFYVTNSAVVTGIIDPSQTDNVAQAVTLVDPPDLAIGATSSPGFITIGQPVAYTFNITNLGPIEADGVQVADFLPTNLTFTTATFAGGTYTNIGNEILFEVGTLTNGQVATMSFTATGNALGRSTNVAIVSDNQFDSVPSNNTNLIVTSVVGPDMGIGIQGSPSTVPAGQVVAYTLSVTNLGPVDGTGIAVTNTLLTNLALEGVSLPLGMTYTTNQNSVIFNVGPMTNGQVVRLGVIAQTLAIGKGTNVATVGDSLVDTNPANNSAKAVTTIVAPNTQFTGVTVVPGVTSAFIVWNTVSNATSQVDYGLTAASNISYLNPALTNHHVVLLTGLTPDSTYVFQVRSITAAVAPSESTNGSIVTILEGGPPVLYVTNGTFTTTSTLIFGTSDANYAGSGWLSGSLATGIFTGPNNNEPYYDYAQGVASSPTASAAYNPIIPVAGLYDISVWYPIKPGQFSTHTPMIANGSTNALLVNVDQTVNGGSWQQIVTGLYFAAGTGGNLSIYNNTGDTTTSVAANGARWVYETSQDVAVSGNVPAWWANFYFGHTVNGSDDADGDGYSNFAEYVFGTDPTSGSSQLQFQAVSSSLTNVTATFAPMQAGRSYQLQSSSSLANAGWVTLTNAPTLNTNDGSGSFSITQTPGANVFYRLTASLLPNQ